MTFPDHAVLGCSADGGSQAWCPGPDSNGHDVLASADFKSAVSTDFTTRAVPASVRCASLPDGVDGSTQHSCESAQNQGIIEVFADRHAKSIKTQVKRALQLMQHMRD